MQVPKGGGLQKRRGMTGQVRKILWMYGAGILESEEFRMAFEQTHHSCETVASHSLGVAVVSIYICLFLYRLHMHPRLKEVTVAALGHDLGILGRYGKYRNNVECCRRHPVDSVETIRQLTGEENERVENAVRRHMWPLTPVPPKHIEGVILTAADKISACMERAGHNPGKKIAAEVETGGTMALLAHEGERAKA